MERYNAEQFHPAIAFFKGSKQENDFKTYQSENDLKIIWKKVAVFLLTEKSDKDHLDIKRIDLTENL